ncbi:Transcription initiation factor IIF subunit beta [Mycena indigotica]|uniref:Transcription initiation factor IIF subunit beta n=1 Tax=Mycena indigotica TaxID=2126181 RepID=A0A8H6SQ23_9AGAR|nr:Transcription initiation factor IIF subunit beta [Mycena indigotica]KAF7303733.1 Transcription initiation factor IIF subunit beta [Mycena indigotica]
MDVEERDEKKAFEDAPDDQMPDPDETLMLDQGHGRVWLVKIPKFLLERWAAVNAEDIHLASIRVYTYPDGRHRMFLFLPPNIDPNSKQAISAPQRPNYPQFAHTTSYSIDGGAEPDCYELDMVNDNVENQVVIAERPKDSSLSISSSTAATTANTRARTTILTGRIKHDCNLRPALSSSYRRQMRDRHIKYNTPQRQIMRIEDAGVAGGRGGINQMTSGVGVNAGGGFRELVKTKQKPAKGQFERMARIPRNQLLDLIFGLFREQPHWGIKPLRERTQQPEAYLKEVLSEVAFLNRAGEYASMWELKDTFKDNSVRGLPYLEPVVTLECQQNLPELPRAAGLISFNDVKMEEGVEEEDDEDEDMEEVN